VNIKQVGGLAIIGLVAVGLYYASQMTLVVDPDRSEIAALQEDLVVFRKEFFEADQSYSEESRARAGTLLSDLDAEAPTLSDAQVQLRLAEIAALAQNGHTMFFTSQWSARFNTLPIRLLVTGDGLLIGHASQDYDHLVGAQVTAIEGHSWDDLSNAFARYHGGREGLRNQYIYYFLESPEILHAASLATASDRLTLSLEVGGQATEVSLFADESLPVMEGIDAILPPVRIAQVYAERGVTDLPLWLGEPGVTFRHTALPDQNAHYVQFRANTDFTGEENVQDFIRGARAEIEAAAPRYIIIDQRANIGGDLNETRNFMQALAEMIPEDGHLFIITGGRTFSAGISSVGYAKQAAGDRATIVGEPIGDRLEFYAEGGSMGLPNSELRFLHAVERHNYMTGCPERDCHGAIRLNPTAVPTLDPEVALPLSIQDYRERHDSTLEWILHDIEARSAN